MESIFHITSIWSRHRLAPFVLLVGLASTAFAEPLTFQQALTIAVQETPALRADVAQIDAARYAVTPAGELPDPKLALGLDNLPVQGADRYRIDRDFMTMRRVAIMQDIPNGAKREARVAAADSRVEVAEAQARITRLSVLRETALAWIARDTVEHELRRIDDLVAQNRLFDAAVRAQIAAGKATVADSVMPRQESAMIEERRDDLNARRRQAIAALKRWIGTAAEAPLAGAAPDWPLAHDALGHALHQHPELALFAPKARMLNAEIDEARAGKHPDWSVELAYQKRGPQFGDMVSAQVSFDLPIFAGSRQNPEIASREAELNALDAERDAALREHVAMLDSDWADYERLRNAEQRQREVMQPLAAEKVRLATAAWRGGKGTLAGVIAAWREQIDTELKIIAVEGERRQMAARLHYAYGDARGETR